ncbi:unnamed protein product [Knipowitschia caucasica]
MTKPIYPGAPWVPKFEGQDGNLKYSEWKEQIQGLLESNNLAEAQKVKIVIGALSGLARRQINVLAEDERDRVTKVFAALDQLYAKIIPLSVVRSQFFGCVQKPGEPVQSYVLRLKELYCRLEEQDTEQAPTDSHLRDQFMLGLEDGALLRALKRVVRLAPDTTFSAIQQEALILEEENMGSRSPHATCAAVREHNPSRSHPQAELWKQELKREIVDELKDFTRELLRELRPNSPVHVPIHRNAPQRSTERRYNPQFADRRDERGRPICRKCNLPGHIARFCNMAPADQPALN